MLDIRPFSSSDLPAVARLFRIVLQHRDDAPPAALEAYFGDMFLHGPFTDPAIPSLVAVEDGDLKGFIGVTVQPMLKGDRAFKAAIASSLMVRDHDQNPLTGVRLMKAFLSGGQDISLTETAGGPSLAIWRQLGGRMLDDHSLDWVRIVSPARFGISLVGRRLKIARLLAPLAKAIDRKLIRRSDPGEHAQWMGLPPDFKAAKGVIVEAIDPEAAGPLIESFVQPFEVRPVWTPAAMTRMLAELQQKPQFGPVRIAAVKSPGGVPIGMFVYYLGAAGHATALQLLARRGQEGLVVDALLGDAAGRGAFAVEGRITPSFKHALMARRCLLLHRSASAVHGQDEALAGDFAAGRGMFNGLVGEYWSRLYGGEFDDAPAPSPSV